MTILLGWLVSLVFVMRFMAGAHVDEAGDCDLEAELVLAARYPELMRPSAPRGRANVLHTVMT